MSQNMPVVIPNSVEDRMLTFPRTYMHVDRHDEMNQHSLPHMEECISLIKGWRLPHTPKKEKQKLADQTIELIAGDSNKQREVAWN